MKSARPVLLITPPFCMPDKPSIAVPTLAGYLRGQDIPVRMLDLNPIVYKQLLTPASVRDGAEAALKHWDALNAKSNMNKEDYPSYIRLTRLLQCADRVLEEIPALFTDSPANSDALRLFRVGMELVRERLGKESVSMSSGTGYVRHVAPISRFSSADIAAHTETTPFYVPLILGSLEKAILEERPAIVGLSVTFPDQALAAFHCARILKKCYPNLPVVMGGAYVTTHLRDVKNVDLFRYLDGLVIGSGERPLQTMAVETTRDIPDWSRVPGLIRCAKDRIVHNPDAEPVALAALPVPPYADLELDDYIVRRENMALLMRTSSGCYWHNCGFCRTQMPFIRDYNSMDPARLVEQLEQLNRETGVRIFHFTDDAAPPAVTRALCDALIATGSPLKWVVNIRADRAFTPDDLVRMREAGCRRVYMGVESFSASVLQRMNKGTTPDIIGSVIRMCADAQLAPVIYMMVGFPGETEAEAQASFAQCLQLQNQQQIHGIIYNVFEMAAHSPVAADPESYGITSIRTQPGKDLHPPVTEFNGPGMSRQTARTLCAAFSSKLQAEQTKLPPLTDKHLIFIGGQIRQARHDERSCT